MRHRIAAGIATLLLLTACSPTTGDGATEQDVATTVGERPAVVAPETEQMAAPEASDDAGTAAEDEVTTTTSTTTTVPPEVPDLDEDLESLESELTGLLDELDDLLADL